MKIKILRSLSQLNLSDTEKVFAYFVSQLCNKYSIEEGYTIDHYDLKLLIYGNPDKHVVASTLNPELTKAIKFAWYSEKRIGFELTKWAKDQSVVRYRNGQKVLVQGLEWVEIESTTSILLFTYLMATLTHMENLTYESRSMVGLDLEDEHEELDYRKTNALQLGELLRVAQLDPRELQ